MMKFRKSFLVTISSLALLSIALLTGCGSQSAQSTSDTAPAASEETAVAEVQSLETPTLGEAGILILSVNPEIRIDYDKDGKVTAISGRNEDGNKIAQAAQDEIGKSCDEVLRNLITEINAAGYFVDDIDGHQKNIVIQIEPGSVLPSDDFLQNMSTSTQDAVKGLSLASDIVTIDEDDYDPTYTTAERPSPYITLEKAQEIALAQADVNAADAVFDDKEFDHDDGTPVFELEFYANGVEYEYDIHAVTGKVIKAEHKESTPAQTPASTPAQTPAVPSAPASGTTDYDDTDYGPNNDGVTDYNDTDYGPNNDGVTDYNDTDYGPNNDGVTGYSAPAPTPEPPAPVIPPAGNTNYDDGGTTNYDDGNSNYDDGASNYDDGNSNYDDGGTTNYTNYGDTNYDDGGSDYDD